jgi:hypothetical protein
LLLEYQPGCLAARKWRLALKECAGIQVAPACALWFTSTRETRKEEGRVKSLFPWGPLWAGAKEQKEHEHRSPEHPDAEIVNGVPMRYQSQPDPALIE